MHRGHHLYGQTCGWDSLDILWGWFAGFGTKWMRMGNKCLWIWVWVWWCVCVCVFVSIYLEPPLYRTRTKWDCSSNGMCFITMYGLCFTVTIYQEVCTYTFTIDHSIIQMLMIACSGNEVRLIKRKFRKCILLWAIWWNLRLRICVLM